MIQSEWWRGLPAWLKLVYALVALPAWSFGIFCILTGQSKSLATLGAFAIFCLAALLHGLFDRRKLGNDQDNGPGIDFGGDGS